MLHEFYFTDPWDRGIGWTVIHVSVRGTGGHPVECPMERMQVQILFCPQLPEVKPVHLHE